MRRNYLYVHIDTFGLFILYTIWVCFDLVILFWFHSLHELFLQRAIIFLCCFYFVCEYDICVPIEIFICFILYNSWLYLVLRSLFYISSVNGLFYHWDVIIFAFVLLCLYILHICLQWYVCVLYSIYSLVVPNLGKIVIYIYYIWFISPLRRHPFLAYINNSLLKSLCFNLQLNCYMHWNTYFFS